MNPMHNPQLKLFTDATVLHHTNRNLLASFFDRFTHLVPKHGLPNPISDCYPNVLAELFQRPSQFPAPLVEALVAVEDLAATVNHAPDPSGREDPDSARLPQAIELCLSSPAAVALTPASPPPASPTPETHNGSPSASDKSPVETLPTKVLSSDTQPTSHDAAPTPNPDPSDDFERLARLAP